MLEGWQNLLYAVNPIAFTIGFFSFYWYSFFYLLGWWSAFAAANIFVKRKVFTGIVNKDLPDLFLWLLIGAILGGKLGYFFLYALPFSLADYRLFFPYDFSAGSWQGISGMSYYGSLVGVTLTLFLFCRKTRLDFWRTADLLALCAPIAVFFGRIGNFINIELPGRITVLPWGMHFPGTFPGSGLRHPSALYEAFFEGIFLFILLIFIRKRVSAAGTLTLLYVLFYAVLRFALEFFREPDPQIGYMLGFFTLGQLLSAGVFSAAFLLLLVKNRKRYGIMPKE